MTAAAWATYAVLLVAGTIWTGMGAAERAYERITLPQLLYFLYLLALGLYSATILSSAPLACVFLALPMLSAAWWTWGEAGSDEANLRAEWQNKLDALRAGLQDDPAAVLPLDALGDLYVQIGEPSLAIAAYSRLESVYEKKTGYGRLLTETRGTLERLRIGGASCAANPTIPKLLRACKDCESVILRAGKTCPSCGAEQYPSPWTRRAALTAHWLEARNLTGVAPIGLVFSPFYRICGPFAYAALWAVWIAAMASSRGEPALLGDDNPRALRLVAAQCALLLGIVAVFAAAPPGPAAPPRKAVRLENALPSSRSGADMIREARSLSEKANAAAERSRRAAREMESGEPAKP